MNDDDEAHLSDTISSADTDHHTENEAIAVIAQQVSDSQYQQSEAQPQL